MTKRYIPLVTRLCPCGAEFRGSAGAKYCPDCRSERNHQSQPRYVPTPEDILMATRKIQEGWNELQEQSRIAGEVHKRRRYRFPCYTFDGRSEKCVDG